MRTSILLSSFFASGTLAAPVDASVNITATILENNPSAFQWNTAVGTKWQIILSQTLSPSGINTPSNAQVWDLDLFNTPESTIKSLKAQGKVVMCYFSAGTSEQGRPDLGGLGSGDVGVGLPDWPGENWLNLRSQNVLNIMQARVKLAASKGCDAIDPDNIDGYSNENGGGLRPPLSTTDSINFVKSLATTAAGYGMAIGLKNSQDILSQVAPYVQFAVNEECANYGDCAVYSSYISAGKPVFHIEYGSGYSSKFCLSSMSDGKYFSTVVKTLGLDGWVSYCDGTSVTTPTTGSSSGEE